MGEDRPGARQHRVVAIDLGKRDAGIGVAGPVFTTFLFQLSFATTATTIVSGGIAERCNFYSYCLFSLVNTVVYCLPAGWLWGSHGFLKKLGAVDIAGAGAVHLRAAAAAEAGRGPAAPRGRPSLASSRQSRPSTGGGRHWGCSEPA